jgi:hypothetical protein
MEENKNKPQNKNSPENTDSGNSANRQKFELGEIVFYSLFALFIDGLCLLLDLTVVGLVIAPILQGLATFGFSVILKNKGDSQAISFKKQIGPQALNLLPVLPTVFGMSLRRMMTHNNPKISGLTGGTK